MTEERKILARIIITQVGVLKGQGSDTEIIETETECASEGLSMDALIDVLEQFVSDLRDDNTSQTR